MKITLTEKTYTVNDSSYTWKFIDSSNGITIPGTHGNGLHFSNAKKQMVKSFHHALGMFLDEIDTTITLDDIRNAREEISNGCDDIHIETTNNIFVLKKLQKTKN